MQNELEWRHAYQEWLEKLYALDGEASQTAGAGAAQYETLSQTAVLNSTNQRDASSAEQR